MNNPFQYIIAPLVTEKSNAMAAEHKYAFRVKADAGKLALMRGPVVYCAEGIDHPFSIFCVAVDPDAPVEVKENYGGLPTLQCGGWLPQDDGALYSPASETEEKKTPVTLRFIPYFTFANRGSSDLLVWLRRL